MWWHRYPFLWAPPLRCGAGSGLTCASAQSPGAQLLLSGSPRGFAEVPPGRRAGVLPLPAMVLVGTPRLAPAQGYPPCVGCFLPSFLPSFACRVPSCRNWKASLRSEGARFARGGVPGWAVQEGHKHKHYCVHCSWLDVRERCGPRLIFIKISHNALDPPAPSSL